VRTLPEAAADAQFGEEGVGAMRCEEAMTEEVETVGTTDTVLQAARTMRDLDVGFLPVCQGDGAPVGTITDRDIVLRVVAEEQPASTAVEEVMSTELISCRPGDDVGEAARLMRVYQVSRVLVIGEDGRVAGVISLSDLSRSDDEPEVGQTLADLKEGLPGAH
jgi:CBS domain-containing protein